MGFVLLNLQLDVKDPRCLLPCKWEFKNGRETNRSARKNDVSFNASTEHTSCPQAACHISVTISLVLQNGFKFSTYELAF